MSLLESTPYDPDREPSARRLAWALHEAWAADDWTTFGALLRPEVVYESPGVGRIEGREAVVALYRERRRFPGLTSIEHRRTVAEEDVVARVAEITIEHERRVTVTDLLTVRQGRVAHWLSTGEAWP
jgi:limonene-1,2-epoxide hydrolase